MAKKKTIIRGTIVQEPYGDSLIRTYDSEGYYILQNETGIKYAEAIDIPEHYTYSETDEKIEATETKAIKEDE